MTAPPHITGPGPRRVRWTWWDTALVGAIVASGVAAASTLPRQPETDGPVAIPYTSEPVAYPVQIPGCDEVRPPPPSETAAGWTMYGVSHGYGDPDFPWLSASKAAAMSDALRSALPTDVSVRFDTPRRMLLFQPIFRMNPDRLPASVSAEDVTGNSEAGGALVRGVAAGTLRAAVRSGDRPPPECVAGDLDERRTLPDGTVVDILDTWSERRGVRTLTAVAIAYPPDGSRVSLVINDADGETRSGVLPLTVDELAALAADPGLRTTTPVPVGTVPARMGCGAGIEPMAAPLTRSDVDRLDAALTTAWNGLGPMPATPDRPIGSLELTASARDAACVEVELSSASGDARLGVTIAVDTSAPEEYTATDIRPHGIRVRIDDRYGTTHVTAARPSGTAVTVTLGGIGAGPTRDQLVALATAPGLDL